MKKYANESLRIFYEVFDELAIRGKEEQKLGILPA